MLDLEYRGIKLLSLDATRGSPCLHWLPCPSSEAEKRDDSAGGSWQSNVQRTYSQDCSFKDSKYHVGDYVYVEPAEPNLQPHIIYIERLWQDNTGQSRLKDVPSIKVYNLI